MNPKIYNHMMYDMYKLSYNSIASTDIYCLTHGYMCHTIY